MTKTERENVERLCARLCHPKAAFRPTISDARDAAETLRALLDRAEKAEAKLAECEARLSKAMSFAEGVVRYAGNGGDDYLADQARATLEELKGDTND